MIQDGRRAHPSLLNMSPLLVLWLCVFGCVFLRVSVLKAAADCVNLREATPSSLILIHLTRVFSDCGRTPAHLENTHTSAGSTCKRGRSPERRCSGRRTGERGSSTAQNVASRVDKRRKPRNCRVGGNPSIISRPSRLP